MVTAQNLQGNRPLSSHLSGRAATQGSCPDEDLPTAKTGVASDWIGVVLLRPMNSTITTPEQVVGALALLGLSGIAVWRLGKWFLQSPAKPDPWDAQVAVEVSQENATPLCPHCLLPQPAAADFCTNCGATVGQYTNWLPFPQLFSIGHVLRIGAFGKFKRSRLIIFGFWFFGLFEYSVFAPFYWFRLLQNRFQPGPESHPPSEQIAPTR